MLEKGLGLAAELDEIGSHGLDGGAERRDVDGRGRRGGHRGSANEEYKLREEGVDMFRGFEALKSGDLVVKL